MGLNSLRGLTGPAMGGPKRQPGALVEVLSITDASTGSGSVTAQRRCVAMIYAWGAGGSGWAGGSSAGKGGSGAALYKRLRLNRGQSLSYSIGSGGAAVADDGNTHPGNPGGPTTIMLPQGVQLVAGGGSGGAGGVAGAGGTATGGDVNRAGTPGGSAPGFTDVIGYLAGGLAGNSGFSGGAGTVPGGPGGAGSSGNGSVSGMGAGGRAFIILVRTL